MHDTCDVCRALGEDETDCGIRGGACVVNLPCPVTLGSAKLHGMVRAHPDFEFSRCYRVYAGLVARECGVELDCADTLVERVELQCLAACFDRWRFCVRVSGPNRGMWSALATVSAVAAIGAGVLK